jgi:hypothetical protein
MTLTPRDKRMLQVLGVVAGLAIIYFLYTTLLGGDGGEDLAAPTGPTGTLTGPSSAPTVTESPTPRETLPPVDLAGARDPFSIPPALQTASGSVGPTGATGPTGTTTTPPVTTTTPPVTTTSPPPTFPTTPPTSPPPGGGGGNEEPTDHISIGGHDLTLDNISGSGSKLQVKVDGDLWTVEEGALFADNFKLVRINGSCARFLFGDQSFTLCET